jgi:deazaflavin-dependent oxidoreductase (nitroreductase family)
MTARIGTTPGAPPRFVFSLFNPIAKGLLRAGVPLGFNGLVAVRGRKTGQLRTTPVAIIETGGRRWIWSPFGEAQWVRNLRVAGQATITVRRRTEEVQATELDPTERVAFFRDTLGPIARNMRGGVWFIRTFDKTDLNDPVEAARGRAVFELHARG